MLVIQRLRKSYQDVILNSHATNRQIARNNFCVDIFGDMWHLAVLVESKAIEVANMVSSRNVEGRGRCDLQSRFYGDHHVFLEWITENVNGWLEQVVHLVD